MHKILPILFTILFLSSALYASGPDSEDSYGDTIEVSKYQVSMKKAEAYYTTGNYAGQWYTVAENSSGYPLNIASASAGQEAGNFFTGQALPIGHISQIRQTIIGSFVIKATVNQDGTTYYSTSASDHSASTDSSLYAESTIPFEMPDGSHPSEIVGTPENVDIEVAEGVIVTMKVTFNLLSSNSGGTSGAVGLRQIPGGGWAISPRQPNVTQEITYG